MKKVHALILLSVFSVACSLGGKREFVEMSQSAAKIANADSAQETLKLIPLPLSIETLPSMTRFIEGAALGFSYEKNLIIGRKDGRSLLFAKSLEEKSRMLGAQRDVAQSESSLFSVSEGEFWELSSKSITLHLKSGDLASVPFETEKENLENLRVLSFNEKNIFVTDGKRIDFGLFEQESLNLLSLDLSLVQAQAKSTEVIGAGLLDPSRAWVAFADGSVMEAHFVRLENQKMDVRWVYLKFKIEGTKPGMKMLLRFSSDVSVENFKAPLGIVTLSGSEVLISGNLSDFSTSISEAGADAFSDDMAASGATENGAIAAENTEDWKSEILPLLQRHCADGCHADGLTVDKKMVVDAKASFLDKLKNNEMPPVYAGEAQRNISDENRKKLIDWLDPAPNQGVVATPTPLMPDDEITITDSTTPSAGSTDVWTREILPLLQRHCADGCHANGLTVDKKMIFGARASFLIKMKTFEMPPVYASADQKNLSAENRKKLIDWLTIAGATAVVKTPTPTITPGSNDPWKTQILPLLQKYCAGGCHSNGLTVSKGAVIGAKDTFISKISNFEMPPRNASTEQKNITQAEREIILNWLDRQ